MIKTMKETMKCFIAVFVMAMAFVVTGITAKAATNVNPFVVKDYNSSINPTIYTENFAVGQTTANATISVPCKGTVILYAVANTDVTMNINGASSGYNLYLYANESVKYKEYDFSAKGSYAITMTRNNDDAKSAGVVKYYAIFLNSGEAAVKANQITAFYSQNFNAYSYTKINVSKTGYIKVDTPNADGYSVYVTLCNSKKQAVSEEIYTSKSYFAVSKGTYYIKTRASYGSIYNLKYSFTAVKEKSGSKKSKAVTIKSGKTVKGVLTANGKNQTDWYKVKLTKKKTFKLTVKSYNTDNDIKIQIIPASKRTTIYGDTASLYGNGKSMPLKSKGKFPAGTYYIKVTKCDKKASGYYQIKFNK